MTSPSQPPADAASYWRERGESYRRTIESSYHRNRLQMVDALLAGIRFDGTMVLDMGCGDGVYAQRVLGAGAKAICLDIDPAMITATRALLAPFGDRTTARVAGVTGMKDIAAGSVDHVLALNVLAYLTPDEDVLFYEETRRILKPGGTLTVTHSNELFDMFTLNRYTAAFFERNFSRTEPCDIRSLLVHPDRPARHVFGVRENPLSYRYKLGRYGLTETRQEFAILHRKPPLLTPDIDFDDIANRDCPDTLNWPAEERWKLAFMCSIFGSHATRD